MFETVEIYSVQDFRISSLFHQKLTLGPNRSEQNNFDLKEIFLEFFK